MTARIARMRKRKRASPGCQAGRPFRSAQLRRGQNSAGRYPLISRPMQISTRIGVVQAIDRLP